MLQPRNKPKLFAVARGQRLQPGPAHQPTRLERVESFLYWTARRKENGKNLYFVGTGVLNQRAVAKAMDFDPGQLTRILDGMHTTEGVAFRRALCRFAGYVGPDPFGDLEDRLREYETYPRDAFRKYRKRIKKTRAEQGTS